jgi:hypothetical protein
MRLFFKRKKETIASLTKPKSRKLTKPLTIAGKFFILLLLILTILATGVYIGQKNPKYSANSLFPRINLNFTKPKDSDVKFFSEIYNLIKNNYWDKTMDDVALSNLYLLAIQKLTSGNQVLLSQNEAGVEKILNETTKTMNQDSKITFIAQLSDVVLQNLKPFGRSRLYGEKMITNIQNEVKNANPDKNLYADLGVTNSAPQQEISQAYENKISELKSQGQTSEVLQKIQEVQKAYDTIGDTQARKTYDVSGVESTVSYKLISPRIFYMHFTRFSPTSLEDINRAATKVDSGNELDTLIFDLRDNIGGLVDGLPYFLGPFIGPDQYAYQLFSRGEKIDIKTKLGWLPSLIRYKKVVVLINGGCQSSTEVFAATLKKYNVGVLVGTKTRGWGTIEKIEPLNNQPSPQEKYSVLLVEQITLRDDGQSIEGLGVEPNINIASEGWETELFRRFNSQEIVTAVKDILKQDIEVLAKK